MQNLGSATLEDIEILVLGGAWMELSLELRSALRVELQDAANNYRTRSLFERNTAQRILHEHDDRYSHSEHIKRKRSEKEDEKTG